MEYSEYKNLIEPVIRRSQLTPDHPALIFIGDDGSEEHISAGQFDRAARAYAGALRSIGVGPGDLVILVLKHAQTLPFAFWGAMYLGAIASIFPYLTEKLDPQLYMERVQTLAVHSGAKAVITFPEFKARLSALLANAGCSVIGSDEVKPDSAVDNGQALPVGCLPDFASGEDIAFLQHSSGTTGLQKGVALSHRAVLNQIEAYKRAIDLQPDDVIVSWLPLYHDMGLIAGFVMPLTAGVPLVLMSPFKWVRDPKTLLQTIHRHRGTLCWLPNFAYNHSARVIRPRDLEGLDLSRMRAFINCSEPVYLESHRVFAEKFAPFGLRREALSTCYAMAENTFAVTQYPIGGEPTVDWVHIRSLQEQRRAIPMPPGSSGAVPMVSCGFPIPNTQLQILDDRQRRLADRRVGEIALRSNCMLSEYYRRPEITAEAIRDGWYLTGDMGYLAEGELYITGRKKDLIIVGGKNIYPQDLEAIANDLPGTIPGRSVAFGMLDSSLGSENIVMICEVDGINPSDDTLRRLESELRKRVVERTEVTLADVRFVGRRWLIKTSSGKISRASNREKYIAEFIKTNQDAETDE